MTPAQIWTYARWALAILLLLLVVRCATPRALDAIGGAIEFDAGEGSIFAPGDATAAATPTPQDLPAATPTLEPPIGPVVDGGAEPIADFHVLGGVADIDTDTLSLRDDPDDLVVIAFDLVPGSPECLTSLTLEMSVAEVRSTTEIGVFLADFPDAAETVDNQMIDEDLLLTPVPAVNALVEEPGRLQLDIARAYRNYFTFDLPPDSPFVMVVQATVPVEPDGGIELFAVNAADADVHPALAWTGELGCTGF